MLATLTTQWGTVPTIGPGEPGVPAIPLCQPFATWVARGWRKTKYLKMSPAADDPPVYYLYASGGRSPSDWFDTDIDDLADDERFYTGGLFDFDAAVREIDERKVEPRCRTAKAIVGAAAIDPDYRVELLEDLVWQFTGGVLFPEAIPLAELNSRPYGGVFYPWGR